MTDRPENNLREDASDGRKPLIDSLTQVESYCGAQEDADQEDEYADSGGFDDDVVAAIHAIKDDSGRQLELASDKHNAMVQSMGIILAFASILFVETTQFVNTDVNGLMSVVALCAFLTCCLIGVATILEWKSWDLYTGSESDKVVDAFNDRNFIGVHYMLLIGIYRSYDAMSDNIYILKSRIRYMALFLFVGIVFMATGMVMKWV